MIYHLFLDDERIPADVTWVDIEDARYVIVRSYNEFVTVVEKFGCPAYVTFDHDLADAHYAVGSEEVQHFETHVDDEFGGLNVRFDYGPEKTGYDCAKWLVDYCYDNGHKFPRYQVHSMNPVGTERIHQYIINAKQHLDI